jgi:hypothetical protein
MHTVQISNKNMNNFRKICKTVGGLLPPVPFEFQLHLL